MRVTKWVKQGKTKTRVDTDLERFDLYLHVEEDAELIDLLKKCRRRHRTGQRLRDLLYAGLAAEQSKQPQRMLPARASSPHTEAPRQQAVGGEIPASSDEQIKNAANNFLSAFGGL